MFEFSLLPRRCRLGGDWPGLAIPRQAFGAADVVPRSQESANGFDRELRPFPTQFAWHSMCDGHALDLWKGRLITVAMLAMPGRGDDRGRTFGE